MFNRSSNAVAGAIFALALLLALPGCQTASPAAANTAEEPAPKRAAGPSSISFHAEPDLLSAVLRQASPMFKGGGIVVMNGIGVDVLPKTDFKNLSTNAFAQKLADLAGVQLATTDSYAFLYPKGYESLASAAFTVDPHYDGIEASAMFGEGTRLYNALAILSQSLGVSLVADNVVADIPAGETMIDGAPLSHIIEALLRGARATPDAVRVESTPDYVFIRATSNSAPPDNLLNDAELTPAERAALDAPVSLVLPEVARRNGAAVFIKSAQPLSDLLASLSKQLGIPVQAAPELADLPVNYTVLNKLSIRTALNLIVRQWPVPRFGFTYRAGVITLTAR